MALIVRNIALGLDEPEESILERAAARLRIPGSSISRHAVVRRSLDARKGREIQFVYSVELALADGPRTEERCLQRLHGRNVAAIEPRPPAVVEPGDHPLAHRPVIVGFGPGGLFAALRLAEFGYAPVVLERGRDVRARHRDVLQTFYRQRLFNPESNLLFGEGGAGAYSDGKVYTRIADPAVRDVLAALVRFGADPRVLIDAKPHIGSDRLPTICRRIREHIERLGGEVRFASRVTDFDIRDGRLVALSVNNRPMNVGPVLLAIGHSARDTVRQLALRGVRLDAKPFQFGVRLEHPQDLVNGWQYGPAAGHPRLPPADYQIVARGAAPGQSDLFSFCMCPGGAILPTIESPGLVATNGASRAARPGRFANSGLVITVYPADFDDNPLAGLEFQRRWEAAAFTAAGGDYALPVQRAADFLSNRPSDGQLEISYPLGGRWCSLADILPPRVVAALRDGLPRIDRQMPGFSGRHALLTAPESRASAPFRVTRDPASRASLSTANLYPIGEGAGYAGGIVSAAVDGLRTADALIRTYRPAP